MDDCTHLFRLVASAKLSYYADYQEPDYQEQLSQHFLLMAIDERFSLPLGPLPLPYVLLLARHMLLETCAAWVQAVTES